MPSPNLLIICPYPEGVAPSQRLKFEQYYGSWREAGYDITIDAFQSDGFWQIVYQKGNLISKITYTLRSYFSRFYRLFTLYRFDIVYVHLWVTPLGLPLLEWLYVKLSKKVVYDIDDLIFMENSNAVNSWMAFLKGKKKPIYLMKHADAIITTTPYLVDFCKKHNSCVVAIPPTLDENSIYPQKNSTEKKLTIGWMGSHTTAVYLDLVKPALQKLAREIDFRLIVVGAKNIAVEGVAVICKEWRAEEENTMLNEMDIALYPLTEDVWSQGKFGGKLIQYFAAGIPTVASDVNDSNRLVIRNMENGILVKNDTNEWLKALSCLAKDKKLRSKMGLNARNDFMSHFSIRANKEKYLNVLNQLVQKN